MTPRGVLIVGATGVLAPAATALARGGTAVTGIARTAAADGPADLLLVEARSASLLAAALAGHRWAAGIAYGPAVTPASIEVLRGAVDGRLVLVRVSAFADPALGGFPVPPDVLQLGWRDLPGGGTRWHSAEEVSAAALEMLGDGLGRVLGSVRPWERRP